MKSQARQSGLPAVVAASLLLLLCTWLQGVHTQVHTRVDVLTDSCDSQLTWLWGNYSSPPVAPVAGCDTACLAGCGSTLDEAIYSEKVQHCPLQTDIIRCFHVSAGSGGWAPPPAMRLAHAALEAAQRRPPSAAHFLTRSCSRVPRPPPSAACLCLQVYRAQWSKFVAECALFQYPASSSSSTPAVRSGGVLPHLCAQQQPGRHKLGCIVKQCCLPSPPSYTWYLCARALPPPQATTTPSSSSSSSSPPPEGAAVPSPPVEGSAAASAAVVRGGSIDDRKPLATLSR